LRPPWSPPSPACAAKASRSSRSAPTRSPSKRTPRVDISSDYDSADPRRSLGSECYCPFARNLPPEFVIGDA